LAYVSSFLARLRVGAMNLSDHREEVFADTIKEIHLSIKNIGSYPEDHPVSRQVISSTYETLVGLLHQQSSLTVTVFGDKLLVDDVPVDGKSAFSRSFARYLDRRTIDSVTFQRGLSLKEFKVFLNAMAKSPSTLTQEGGVTSILDRHRVSTIKLNEIKYGRVSEESNELEDSHIIDYLSGESNSLGDHGQSFVEILEDEPQRISHLIMQVTEARDIAVHPYNQAARAKAAAETMNRIATELLARQGVTWSQFKDTMSSILSTCDEELLVQMSQGMQIIEGEKAEIIEGLVGEFFHDAMADICVTEYRETGQCSLKLLEQLPPGAEERQRIIAHLERKLKGSGGPDVEKIIGDLFHEQPAPEAEKTPEYHQGVSSEDEKKRVTDELSRLLSEGKADEVREIIKELSTKLDDSSWKIRKTVAETLLDVTCLLDEFGRLKDNFRELSEALLKRVRQENYGDIYLIASQNLQRIYTTENRADRFFREETIGSRLFEAEKLPKTHLQKALMARKRNGKSLQYNLGALNLVDETVLTQVLAEQYPGCRVVHLSEIPPIPEDVLRAVPVKLIKRYLIMPFRLDSGDLYTATMNPNDLDVLNDIRFISGYSVVPHLAAEYHLLNAIEKFYGIQTIVPEANQVVEEEGIEFYEEKQEEITPTEELRDSDAPVVKLVNLILKAAITQKASDIHVEPYENELRVRFRIDGTLTTLLTPSPKFSNVITSRIKIMAGLDISERRLPQDGRFKVRMNGSYVDFRVSTFPGIFGEKVVLRVLQNSNLVLGTNNLGLNSSRLNTVLTALYKSKGMILVTGPTGSGKTTTLYSMLHDLNDGSRNICTAEDPIEYNLRGINQFQINPKIGLNFARALRTFLRQDPDIIMVGEIRDLETAEIGVKAALTGHLVLSTLHTNSAPETITRLLDMGIEPYLITSSVNLIVAQRLLRKICDRCKVEASPNELQLQLLKDYGFDSSGHHLFRGEGCEDCNNTGYKGRVAVYEVLPLWEEIQELILKGKPASAIRDKARTLGLITLQEEGFNKLIEGTTDLAEWVRVVT
jgi:type IV pilus assembly protein PilB